ncbi:hypothetical protein T492DRAFT_917263 [Pavlovales sp. CCMP2436]|nr:hypothetical protein T492DRAFT_917263 [Pavlovales sp. CCMP2436]
MVGAYAEMVGAAAVFLGAIGLIVHDALATALTSLLYNHLSSLWGASMLLLAGAELMLVTRAGGKGAALAGYFATVGTCALIYGICYAVDTRFDNLAWGLLQAIVCAAAVVDVLTTRAEQETQDSVAKPCCSRRSCALITMRVIHVLLMLLLAAGAGVCAFAASANFPRTGTLTTVFLQGEPVTLNVVCVDPPADAPKPDIPRTYIPRLWLTSSPAHGTGDFAGLQHFLALQGYRSCAFDPPGFGSSARIRRVSILVESFLPQLIEALEPSGAEVVIVGWGGGGSAAAALGAETGSKFTVLGIVLAEVFPPGSEWDELQFVRKLTDEQTIAYRVAELKSRLGLTQLILGLASPWGLLPLFFPITPAPLDFYPAERYAELRVAAWRPELWVNQYWGIRQILATVDLDDPLVSAAPLSSSLPIGHLLCSIEGDQPCKKPWGELTGDDCRSAKERDMRFRVRQEKMTQALQPVNSKREFAYDGGEFCSLGVVVDFPERTAGHIADLLSRMLN